MRPPPPPWEELSNTPERPCTRLQDATPSDTASSEVDLPYSEPIPPDLPPRVGQSRGSKAPLFEWDEETKQGSLTTNRSAEDDHAPKLAILDMQLTRPSSVPTHHGRQWFMVLLKSRKISLARTPQESLQHISTEIAATEGESIAPRHIFDTAYIEGTFDRIEYGLFRSRPAVFICIDVILKYQPTNIIQATELKFQFGKDNTRTPSNSSSAQEPATPPASLVSNFFAPDELQGLPASSHITKHSHVKPKFGALSVHAAIGGIGKQIAETEQHRWHVQGRVDEHDGGTRDTFSWSIFQNLKSNDSVPRRVRLGMIAFHERKPFYVDVSVDGSIRKGKRTHPTPTRERRWFYPPRFQREVGEYVLNEERLQDYITRENSGIPDVAPDRAMERLRGGDQFQMMNNRMTSGGVGQDITGAAGDAFSLVGDVGGFLDLDTTAADVISLAF